MNKNVFKNFLFPTLILVILISLFILVFNIGSTNSEKIPDNTKDSSILRETSKNEISYANVKNMCWNPRVFYYNKFLQPGECDYIIKLGENSLEKSLVIGANGNNILSDHRKSYGTFLNGDIDPVLSNLLGKIERWTFLPRDNAEHFYLLRYNIGDEYKAHLDFARDRHEPNNRIATVLMYLSDVEEGGQTIFPKANISVSPKKGDAILFWDQSADGSADDYSLHASMPVKKGTKWSLTCWIRAKPLVAKKS